MILPETKKTGAQAIDVWPAPHGNQREQIDAMGVETFGRMLDEHGVRLGGVACYRLGPYRLESEIRLAEALEQRGVVLVCGAGGKRGLSGADLKREVFAFVESMKPHVERAARADCSIAIENHASDLLETPDAVRWFGESARDEGLGLALAPHHLPQDAELIASIVRDLGSVVKFVYAQQHGKGSREKLPKEEELLQMPGRGPLDFGPIVRALREIGYGGYTEIFMHPVPRGVPILDDVEAIAAEVNRARRHLDGLLA
jgi:sugar phosphate isomerase/epimerase